MTELVAANRTLLKQAHALLRRVDHTAYNTASPVCLNSTIGGHLRHVLEHYDSLLRGWASGRVDYDARARDLRVETQPEAARERVDKVLIELADLEITSPRCPPDDFQVWSAPGAAGPGWHPSSAGRELQFLLGHTVHHYALIAVLCHLQGIALEAGFGVAPSTLRHRAASHA